MQHQAEDLFGLCCGDVDLIVEAVLNWIQPFLVGPRELWNAFCPGKIALLELTVSLDRSRFERLVMFCLFIIAWFWQVATS